MQALYYWLRTYLLERRDVASKSEANRMAMAQQRMQQGISGTISASMGLVGDANARVQGHAGGALSSENQVHQATQSSGGIGSHDGGNTHGQEAERSTGVENSVHAGNDQPMQQSSSSINDGGQNALRRNGPLGFMASAASAFDAAKDIMEALRSKHSNLASELEVTISSQISLNTCIWLHVRIHQCIFVHRCQTYMYTRHMYADMSLFSGKVAHARYAKYLTLLAFLLRFKKGG